MWQTHKTSLKEAGKTLGLVWVLPQNFKNAWNFPSVRRVFVMLRWWFGGAVEPVTRKTMCAMRTWDFTPGQPLGARGKKRGLQMGMSMGYPNKALIRT